MIFQTKALVLLRAEHKSFKGTDGSQVEYDQATLLDDEGNKFEMPIAKNATGIIGLEKTEGTATIELFVGKTSNGKAANKLRLHAFEAVKQ